MTVAVTSDLLQNAQYTRATRAVPIWFREGRQVALSHWTSWSRNRMLVSGVEWNGPSNTGKGFVFLCGLVL